jgi:hypothetical protein
MAGRPSVLAGQPPILTDGPLAPLMFSFFMSSTFSKSLEVIRVQHATFAGDASLSGGIALATDAVETTLNESTREVKEGFSLGEGKRKEMNRGVLKEGDHPFSGYSHGFSRYR